MDVNNITTTYTGCSNKNGPPALFWR